MHPDGTRVGWLWPAKPAGSCHSGAAMTLFTMLVLSILAVLAASGVLGLVAFVMFWSAALTICFVLSAAVALAVWLLALPGLLLARIRRVLA